MAVANFKDARVTKFSRKLDKMGVALGVITIEVEPNDPTVDFPPVDEMFGQRVHVILSMEGNGE